MGKSTASPGVPSSATMPPDDPDSENQGPALWSGEGLEGQWGGSLVA